MSQPSKNYFAYGSNIWQPRLENRVGKVRVLGVGILNGFELRWHKRSTDGSGKADIVPVGGAAVVGVVSQLTDDQLLLLDEFEGVGKGYHRDETLVVTVGEHAVQVVTYRADPASIDRSLLPYDWYTAFVVAGARAHGLPAAYIHHLTKQLTKLDPNGERSARRRAELLG
jgi:hypothetical protein